MTDLSFYATTDHAESGVWVDLRIPGTDTPIRTEDGKPMSLLLAGTDSKRLRDASFRESKRYAELMEKAKASPDGGNVGQISHDHRIRLACHAILASNNVIFEGEEVDMSKPEVAKNVLERAPWIAEFIDRWVADRSNFFGKPAPTSGDTSTGNSGSKKTRATAKSGGATSNT